MTYAIFCVLCQAGLALAIILGFLVWANAGFPFYIITRREN